MVFLAIIRFSLPSKAFILDPQFSVFVFPIFGQCNGEIGIESYEDSDNDSDSE